MTQDSNDTHLPPEDGRLHGDESIEAMPVEAPRRAASARLREEDARAVRAASLEAANQSLGDALGLTYRLLQGVMVIMVILFALSGFQQVNESELGLRVRFGEIVGEPLQPGPVLSLPRGFGEIVKVSTAQVQQQLARDFMPGGYNPGRPVDQQGQGRNRLTPGTDGYLMTADSKILHAQAAFSYRRTEPRAYATSLHPDAEEGLVKAMVQRAMLHAFAQSTADELLTLGSGDAVGGSLKRRVERVVQRQIDEADYGLTMDSVTISNITPPLRLRRDFQNVLQAESQARQERERAEEAARRRLTEVAGRAIEPLLDLMDRYELLVDAGNEDEAERVLEEIFAVLAGDRDGANVEIVGESYDEVRMSGTAAEIVSRARAEADAMVDRARQSAETFAAKLDQYRANPTAFLVREWTEALITFLERDSVVTFFVPPGQQIVELSLNDDPEFARERMRARQREMVDENLNRAAAMRDVEALRRARDRE